MTTNRQPPILDGRGRNKRTSGVDRIVGQKLRLRRTILQMSQHDLACKIGITSQQLQKYEAGHNRVSAARLYQLAEELKVPLPWFFAEASADAVGEPESEEAPPRPSATDAPERANGTDDDIIRLLTYYQRIGNPEARRLLVKLAAFLCCNRGD
jgi:transcriptional regulator with XRE-family HTH domain